LFLRIKLTGFFFNPIPLHIHLLLMFLSIYGRAMKRCPNIITTPAQIEGSTPNGKARNKKSTSGMNRNNRIP
jgi:hypothetical protein